MLSRPYLRVLFRTGMRALPWLALFAAALVGRALAQSEGSSSQAPAASYIGAQACVLCHRDLGVAWSGSAHGKALSNPSLPPDEQGCEACHGPGSLHAGSTGKQKLPDPKDMTPAQVEAMCGKCHLAEQGAPAGTPALDRSAWQRSGHRGANISCTVCHRVHGSNEKALVAPADKLCVTCHADLTKTDQGTVHPPVQSGQCVLCHDPHGTSGSHSVRSDIGKICEQCHQPDPKAHQGYNVSGSNCTSCHDPHSFDREHAYLRKVAHPPFQQRNCKLCHVDPPSTQLRQASVGDTCAMCHPKDQLISDGATPKEKLDVHAPVAAGLCTNCHNPHVADTANGLYDTPLEVCSVCHRAITTTARSASHPHPPVAKGDCFACHRPHASSHKKLLKMSQVDLCKTCHKDQAAHAHPVGDSVKDPNTGNPVECTSCHGIHGSNYPSILRQEETSLCLTCHRMDH